MLTKHLLCLASVLLLTNQCFSQFFDNMPLYRINSQTFKQYSNQEIKNVSFAFCKISTVDKNTFSQLERVVEIRLDNNEIRSLHENLFDNNVKLLTLNLERNRFVELPPYIFAKLTSLKVLTLSHNSIMALDFHIFENLKSLKNLNIFHNALMELNVNIFRNNINLEYLNFADNYIENLHEDLFNNLPQLKTLFLHRNKLVYFPKKILSKLRNLKDLSIAFNSILQLDSGTFDSNNQLENVWLGANKLTTLKSGLFSNAIQMKYLDLEGNKIENIELDVFADNSKLQKLLLSNNSLTYLDTKAIENLQHLTSLTLHSNPWNCDCHLTNLYKKWKQIKPQSKSPICFEPPKLQNKFWSALNLNDFPPCTILSNTPTVTNVHLSGDKATLGCKTDPTSEDPWKFGDTALSEYFQTLNKPYKVCQSIAPDGQKWYNVTIEDLKPSDSGKYKCADQEQDLIVTSNLLKQLEKPTLSLFINKDVQLNADFGENITASCQIYSPGQKPSLVWSFNSQPIDGSSSTSAKFKISESDVDDHFAWYNLTITSVTDDDNGDYSCRADGYDDVSRFTLKVNKKLNTYIQGWTDY